MRRKPTKIIKLNLNFEKDNYLKSFSNISGMNTMSNNPRQDYYQEQRYTGSTTQSDRSSEPQGMRPMQYSESISNSNYPNPNQQTSSMRSLSQIFSSSNYPEFTTAVWKDPQYQYFKNLIEALRVSNKRFTDYDFPPTPESLSGGDPAKASRWEFVCWRRATEIWPATKLQIFSNSMHPNDISQGQLGNVYFTAALSALLENPQRIRKLFSTEIPNDFGCYAVRICDMGEWREVIVDDSFPCYDKQSGPVFTSGKQYEMWVLLLEKALAKLYGGYGNIELGVPLELLHDLTGAPTQYYFLQNVDPEFVWKDLTRASKVGFPVVGDSKDQVENGLNGAHYYTLINTYELNVDYTRKRVLKLRDPWQDTNWKGEWSDNWPGWTPEIKKLLGFDYRDKNVFYISFEEFLRWFDNIQICQVRDNFSYSHIKSKTDSRRGAYFRLKVQRPGDYAISVKQRSKRFFKPSDNYRYSYLNLVIGKETQNGDFEFVDGIQRAEREVTKQLYLQPGVYYLYVKFYWNDKGAREFVVSSYGPDEASIEQVAKYQIQDFLDRVYLSKARNTKELKSYQEEGEPNVFKASDLTPEGIGYFYFLNRGNAPLVTEISFKTMQGIKLRKPYRGGSFKINVNPGEEKIVLSKIDPNIDAKQVFTEAPSFLKSDYDLIRATKEKGTKKQRSDTKTGQPVEIWCYVHKHTNGVVILYENKTPDLVLEEEVKFDLKGLNIEDDWNADKIKFQLAPGQNKIVKLKKTQPEFAISYNVSYLVKNVDELNPLPQSDQELLLLAKQKGQQKQRKDTTTGLGINIYCYVYQHPDGVVIAYENATPNKFLDEEIKFELKGLRIEEDPTASKVKFVLEPNQIKVIRLKKLMDEFAISYNVSYLVKDVPENSHKPAFENPTYKQQQPPLKDSATEMTQSKPYSSEKEDYRRNPEEEFRKQNPPTRGERVLSSQPYEGENQPPYGQQQNPTYGQQNPVYNQQYQPPYNQQQTPYQKQPSYGQQPPNYDQQRPYDQQPPYNQPQPYYKKESSLSDLKRRAREEGTRKQRKNTKTNSNVEIFLYVLQHEDGVFLLYENRTTDLILDEEIKFDLKGLILEEDPSQTILQFELPPGRDREIRLRRVAPEFAIAYNVSYIVKNTTRDSPGKMSEWDLVNLAKEQGQRKQRKDVKTGVPVDIFMYLLQHDQGIYIYYENNSKNIELDEEVKFELKGLQLAADPEGSIVRLVLKPGQSKGISIVRVAEEYSISYNVSYLLKYLS